MLPPCIIARAITLQHDREGITARGRGDMANPPLFQLTVSSISNKIARQCCLAYVKQKYVAQNRALKNCLISCQKV